MIEKLIITITSHPLWGRILQPVLIQEESTGFLSIQENVNTKSPLFSKLDSQSMEIVQLAEKISDKSLIKSYSKEKTIVDFHKKVTPETIENLIRPCIESYQKKIINILCKSDIPLYVRESTKIRMLYDTDRVIFSDNSAQAVFNFIKNEDSSIRYFVHVKWENEELNLNAKSYYVICSKPAVLVVENKLLIFDDIDIKKLIPFFSKTHIDIPAASVDNYIRKFVLNCVESYEVKSEGIDIHQIKPNRQATLSLENDLNMAPVLTLNFKYGERLYPLDTPNKKIVFAETHNGETSLSWFYPDKEWELSLKKMLIEGGLKKSGLNQFSLDQKDETESREPEDVSTMVDWIRQHQDILKNFNFTQEFHNKIYFTGEISLDTEIETKQDWFDIHCEAVFGEFRIPFNRFRSHILNNIREYVLPDDSIAILPLEWFSRYYELMLFSKKSGENIRLKKYHFQLVNTLEGKTLPASKQTDDSKKVFEVPAEICGTLRNYQQAGFSWLIYLYENNFGGILADDMGLGKTIQTIALLQHIADQQKETGQNPPYVLPSLIVMPTSLIHNWKNELNRFAPKLKVYEYVGAKRLKSNDIDDFFHLYDVIITTYGTLRNDIEQLQLCSFHHLILDESQYVKNPDSLSYKAVKKIKSKYKLALTGTPVENSLTDLWAQMNIVNEGLLGSYTAFRNAYINPINKDSKEKEDALLRMIQPFILRRTKDQVAPELPPLSEKTVYCNMEEVQEKCYNVEKNRLRNSLIENETGMNAQRVTFLALQGLTRLRLLANHPLLMDADYNGGSGKFDEIIMRFETLKSENHKVLIFSSFVKHLHLLANHFDKENWKYAWLSGSTSGTDREKEINKFMQESDVNCFLISLKAGGVGLNLTAADYVFIIDPWWNPAAEMQALSRSHRIGQDKSVMVYRFISLETIEEKIRRLQESKAKLAKTFITSSNPLCDLKQEELDSLLG